MHLMETLARIFGSETKVKMMKLFLFNGDKFFTTKEISDRTKSDVSKVRKEASTLEKMGLVRKKNNKRETWLYPKLTFPLYKTT